MTENYPAKRVRMQKALDSLPANLRNRISLRNAKAVADLSPVAQDALAQSLDRGLKRLAQAVQLLNQNPNASLDELLPAGNKPAQFEDNGRLTASAVSAIDTAAIPALTALIQSCYPDMPRLAAEALASAPAMEGLRSVLQVHESLFVSQPFRSDFVVVTFWGFLRQTQERLNQIISQTPAYQQTLRQSGAGWQD